MTLPLTPPAESAILPTMPPAQTRASCTAQGTHDGAAWACSRPAASGGLCEGHRKARQRGRPLMPLREVFRGPGVQLTIRVTAEERAQLGADPSGRAGAIVRAALAERRRRREAAAAQPQLGLRLAPPRRRSGGGARRG